MVPYPYLVKTAMGIVYYFIRYCKGDYHLLGLSQGSPNGEKHVHKILR